MEGEAGALTTYADRPHELSADVGIGMLQAGLGPGVRYLERGWDQLVDALAAAPGVDVGALALGPPAETSCLDLGIRGAPPQSIALGVDIPLYASLHSAPGGRAPTGCSAIALAEYLGNDVEPSRDRLEAYAGLIGIAADQIVSRRYLHRMVACTAIPLASQGGLVGRPAIDALGLAADRPGTFVAGDWVGPEGHLADAVLASARSAALAAVHHVERQPVSG